MTEPEPPRRRFADRYPYADAVHKFSPYFVATIYIVGSFLVTIYVVDRLKISGEAAAALAGMVVGLVFGKMDLIFPSLFPVFSKEKQNAPE